MYYVGLDVHKRSISYCVKQADGTIVRAGKCEARRSALSAWMDGFGGPWTVALEATMFTGWIYDWLQPRATAVKVAHPAMLRAIVASKHKNDPLDAETICDLLRCDLLPECFMQPPEIRDLRRVLRYRNLMVGDAVRMKNRIGGLLMECGVECDKRRLHGGKYFEQLSKELQDVPAPVVQLLRLSRFSLEQRSQIERQLLRGLERDPLLKQRVERLKTIPAVGVVTALSWALEIGDVTRFRSLKHVISYCGLCSAEVQSGDKLYRRPLSKQRNRHLQHVLVEAAKLAPRLSPELALLYEQARQRGPANRATLELARKLTAYLFAVDRRGTEFAPATAHAA